MSAPPGSRTLHAKLDAAVAAAYGFEVDLSEETILEKLLALNRERTAQETSGVSNHSSKKLSRARTEDEFV